MKDDKRLITILVAIGGLIATLIISFVLIFVCSHDTVYENIIKVPTCISDGQVDITCSECGKVMESRILEATGHVFGEYELIIPPSKNRNGLEISRCENCNAVCSRVYICKHQNLKTVTTPPTCAQQGIKETICSLCDTILDVQYIEMLECIYGDWFITKSPTCVERGAEQRICTECGSDEERILDFADCDYKFAFESYDQSSAKVTKHYECICGNEREEAESVYAKFNGTLWIESVDLMVNTYNSYAQGVCDRQNSACHWNYHSKARVRDVKVVADHWNQGFDKIKKCKVGDIAKINNEKYECIEIFTGHNVWSSRSYLSDDDYKDITTHDGDLFMYTCNDHWTNITIVAWDKIE